MYRNSQTAKVREDGEVLCTAISARMHHLPSWGTSIAA
jgi:hypothetical protein